MAVYVNESGTVKNLVGEYLIIDKYYTSTTIYDLEKTGSKVRVTAGDGKIYCTWDAVETATKYAVSYKGPEDSDWNVCALNLTTTEYTITGLENYTQYIVLVQAYINRKWTSVKYCDRVMTKPDVDEQEIPTITIPDVSGYLSKVQLLSYSSCGSFTFDFNVKIAIVFISNSDYRMTQYMMVASDTSPGSVTLSTPWPGGTVLQTTINKKIVTVSPYQSSTPQNIHLNVLALG